jgi:type I restriction enzyme S subunit
MTTIGEVAEIYDGPHATPEKIENGPYYLSISSLERGRLDLSKSAFLSESDFQTWTKRVTPQKGDILFSYETRLGEAALMPEGIRACLGRRMGLLRPKINKVTSEYLLYAYIAPQFQQTIVSNTIKGATVERIALNKLSSFNIRIPDFDEQKKVAGLLTSIDSKIELNNRINTELEAMAKTLYNYWFVQFDFPDKDGKPYKTSGGKMAWNEELKRAIPDGWVVSELRNLVDVVKGNISPEDILPTTPYVGLEHIGRKTIVLSDWTTSDKASSDKTVFKKHDILFGKIRPYFHKVAVALFDGITSTDTILLRPKKSEYFGLALETVFTEKFVNTATSSSTGSKMPRADWNVLQHYKIPVPDLCLLQSYQELFDKVLAKIEISVIESRKLTLLRDWLLPMLMNGQVQVMPINHQR